MNKYFFNRDILAILLFVLTINLTNIFSSDIPSVAHYCFPIILVSCIFAIPTILFFKNLKFYVITIIPFFLINLVSFITEHYYHTTLDRNIMVLSFESSEHDKIDFFESIPLSIYAIVFVSILIYSVLIWLIPRQLSLKKASVISLLAVVTLFTLAVPRYVNAAYIDRLRFIIFKYTPIYEIGEIVRSYELFKQSENHSILVESKDFNSRRVTENPEKEVYIFVLGETARYDRWSIHGYERETSPMLSNIENLVSVPDIVALGYNTFLSVPLILTDTNIEEFDTHFSNRSFIKIFQEAGFDTYWIGNKYSKGAASIDIHHIDVDSVIIPGITHYTENNDYDEVVIPIAEDIIKTSTDDVFIFIHLIGSHWKYHRRYPVEFEKYTPAGEAVDLIDSNNSSEERINNGYDNTILYTDYVLGSLIKQLESENIIANLVYVSDHGENLLDDHRQLFMHANSSKYTHHIPVFFWFSEKFLKINRENLQCFNDNVKKPMTTQVLFHTIPSLANLDFSDLNPILNIKDCNFSEGERKVITEKGIVAYEEIE